MSGSAQVGLNIFSLILDNCCQGLTKNLNKCRQLVKFTMSNIESLVKNENTNNEDNAAGAAINGYSSVGNFIGTNVRRAWSAENLYDTRFAQLGQRRPGDPYFYVNPAYTIFPVQQPRTGYFVNGFWYPAPDYFPPIPPANNSVNISQNYFYGASQVTEQPPTNMPIKPSSGTQVKNVPTKTNRNYCMRRINSDENIQQKGIIPPKVLKLLSKRYWENVNQRKSSLKPGVEFIVMSYNVLAQDLITEHPYLYKNHNQRALSWERRWRNLFEEISKMMPDILCLQEVQETHLYQFYSRIETLGYKSVYKKRTGLRCDGCAVYYKADKFNLIEYETVEFFQPNVDILNRDNVAIVAKFAPVCNPHSEFVVATTHLLYNPKRQDVRLAQTQLLLTEVERMSFYRNRKGKPKYWPIIITGDFNSTPDSAVYNLITKGVVKYSHLSAKRLDEPSSANHGNVLVPSHLEITDTCQHASLLKKRQKLESLSRLDEFALIRLHNSCRSLTKEYSESVHDPTLFCSGTLSHRFYFTSVYDHGDPENVEGTTFQEKWLTVDYIFYSGKKRTDASIPGGKLKLISRYRLPRRSELGSMKIPNCVLGSDHLSLIAKFKLKI